ncbi:hypothetical protein FF38_04215 [Lucilia cuprina]|uniref:Uncharacterized protein n=1 Tax=Lucilia cuprina TaxID=7375 RepID=A0A0L0BNT0_LUCCU|nr:hypothetical protein FF38_04215 [Lucilia cuprina]
MKTWAFIYSSKRVITILEKERQTKPLMKENISKDQEPVCNDEPDAEFSVKCLRNDTITMDELDIYWRKCSNYRLNQIKKLSTTLDILNEWPEYKKPSGYQLIDIDFCIRFPTAKTMEVKWDQYSEKINILLKNKIVNSAALTILDKSKTCNEESKVFSTFWLLHHLLPPSLTVLKNANGSKRRKKFSIEDSQQSFALMGKTQEEVDAKLNLLKIQKTNIQPLLLKLSFLDISRFIVQQISAFPQLQTTL